MGYGDIIGLVDERPPARHNPDGPGDLALSTASFDIARKSNDNHESAAPAAGGEAGYKDLVTQARAPHTGSNIPAAIPFRAEMEAAFASDFSTVQVRRGRVGELEKLGARAVTRREEITVGSAPDRRLIAHELTHVMQQRRGGGATQAKPIESDERDALEHEADVVSARVATGESAGPIHGATQGTELRDDDTSAVDVLPPPMRFRVLGDSFGLTFFRGSKSDLCINIHYEGALHVDAPFLVANAIQLSAELIDGPRKFNARPAEVGGDCVILDLYGDGLTLAKLQDTPRPDIDARTHQFSWSVGLLGLGSFASLTLKLPAESEKPVGLTAEELRREAVASTKLHAVDLFNLSARRYGDSNLMAVTLSGSGVYPNPQTFTVPVTGDLTRVSARVVKNDGRTISIDLNSDGMSDLTMIHTVKEANRSFDGAHQSREHHFRRFDEDGVLIGDRPEGMTFVTWGPVLAIPNEQNEATNAPDLVREPPASRAPQQGDVLGELPEAVALPGGLIEMRVDGDGDRTKELLLRFKGLQTTGTDGRIRLDIIQLSSIGRTGRYQSATFDMTADAAASLAPRTDRVANGHDPMLIKVTSSYGQELEMKLFPPAADATGSRIYTVDFADQRVSYTFPGEPIGLNELVKDTTAEGNLGNIARFSLTLGEFGDRFWVLLEPQLDGRWVFSVVAVNPEGPASARGAPLVIKNVSSFTRKATGPLEFSVDLDGDGKPDVRIFDALSAPTALASPNTTLRAERQHIITVAGSAIGDDKTWSYCVRDGRFTAGMYSDFGPGTADKAAAAAAAAVHTLGEQAIESRTKDEFGNALKEGDVDMLRGRVAGALTENRQKAMNSGLISKQLYITWRRLSEAMIMLGPQVKAGKPDPKLQASAADTAELFYQELSRSVPVDQIESNIAASHVAVITRKENKLTGTVVTSINGRESIEGPGIRLPGELRTDGWPQAIADYEALVGGLDRLIALKMTKDSDDQKQQQFLIGMHGALTEVRSKPGIVRVNAVFQPDEGYNTNLRQWPEIPLMLFAWQEDGKWWLKDITNPARDPFLDRVDAKPNEIYPPRAIFEQLDYARHFPKGVIHYQIPGGPGGQIITTERKHWWEFAQWVGLGLAVVGISLATFGTGTVAATAAAVAFAASGVAGAVYATGDLHERAKHGDLEPAAVVMDVAQIAAGVFTAGAAISGRIIVSAAQADLAASRGVAGAAAWSGAAARIASFSQKAYIPAITTATAADAVSLLAFSADIMNQIERIRQGEGSDADKKTAIASLIAQGLALGGITILSVKGSMPEITSGRPMIYIDIVDGIPIARASALATYSGQEWVVELRTHLDPEAQLTLDAELGAQLPQEIMRRYGGDINRAVKLLSTPGAKTHTSVATTVEKYTNGSVPISAKERQDYLANPANWQPERAALHARLLAKAKLDSQEFVEAAKSGQPTLYAMRGNTAAGKTRAVSSNVKDLKQPLDKTATLRHRSVNPDNFKADLLAESPGLTSQQVHDESSMLARRFEKEILGIRTRDGEELGSILIDKRLAELEVVEAYAKMAKESGRRFVLYDVDAPLEVSLVGVLERPPGGGDPSPPFGVVAGGFDDVRGDRLDVIEMFKKEPALGEYELYAATSNGERVRVARVRAGQLEIENKALYDASLDSGNDTEILAGQQITQRSIDRIVAGLSEHRQKTIREVLNKYVGWTWKSALDAHSTRVIGK